MTKNYWLTYLEIFLTITCIVVALMASVHEQVIFIPLISLVILNFIQRQQLVKWYDTSIEQILNTVNEKISVAQLDDINQDFQRYLDELESINLQETSRLQEAIGICVKKIKITKQELLESVRNQFNEVNTLVEKLKNNDFTVNDKFDENKLFEYFLTRFFPKEFEEIQEELVAVKNKYEDQKIDLINIMSQKYQSYIANIKELLMPLTERQDYLENIYNVQQQQIDIEIEDLKINLDQTKQQQQEYFVYFNRFLTNPLDRQPIVSENSQEVNEQIIREEISNLEKSLTQTLLENKENISKLTQLVKPIQTNNDQNKDELKELKNDLILTKKEQQEALTEVNLLNNEQIAKFQELEQNIQTELLLKERQIEHLLELFKEHQQNLDNIMQNDIRQHTDAIEYIYLSIAKINHFLINSQHKYEQLEKLGAESKKKFTRKLSELYHRQIKPIKIYIKNFNENVKEINESHQKLKDLFSLNDFKNTEKIDQLHAEFEAEINKINEIVNPLIINLEKMEAFLKEIEPKIQNK